MPVNAEIADDLVRHRLYVLRVEGGSVARLLQAYEDALGVVERDMARVQARAERGKPPTKAQTKRLEDRQAQLRRRITTLEAASRGELTATLSGLSEAEARIVWSTIHRHLPARVAASLTEVPDVATAVAVDTPIGGRVWTDRLAVDLLEAHDGIRRSLAEAVAAGSSVEDAARALKRGVGLVETYRGRMVSIARTEIQRVANTAAMEVYKRNGDIIKGVVYLATLDSRTCLICAPRHQTTWEMDEAGRIGARPDLGPWKPIPLHPRCRCFAAPITKSWEELGIPRGPGTAGMDGRPPERMDFHSWLQRQPATVQRDILGATRWVAWRQGNLSLLNMQDQGRLLTVRELRALHPAVFGSA